MFFEFKLWIIKADLYPLLCKLFLVNCKWSYIELLKLDKACLFIHAEDSLLLFKLNSKNWKNYGCE